MLNMCLPPSCAHSRNTRVFNEHLRLCCWYCLCWEPWRVPRFTQSAVLPVWFCLFVCFNGGDKKKLFKTLQPLVSLWRLQYSAKVGRTQWSHCPRWQYRGRCWQETWVSRALKQGYRLWTLITLAELCACYRVNLTCSTFLVDKRGIMEWSYGVMRSYLLSQFISVTYVLPSTLGECVSCSRISSVQQWWCL